MPFASHGATRRGASVANGNLAIQVALDRAAFSPGEIDGSRGLLGRCPGSTIVVVPSDHHIRSLAPFFASMRDAIQAAASIDRIVLMAAKADSEEEGYGWIVPSSDASRRVNDVATFVAKPTRDHARSPQLQGGLWSTFIMAARPEVLLSIYERRASWLLGPLIELAQASSSLDSRVLEPLYASVPGCDPSHHIFEHCPELLAVLPMAPCGFTDLGTPEQVRQIQAGMGTAALPLPRLQDERAPWGGCVNQGSAVASLRSSSTLPCSGGIETSG